MSDYWEALDYIHGQKRFGKTPGLDNMRKLMELLGNPQKKLKFIHVAGTNGKGSTCAMIAGILQTAGYRVGLYTSPYIVDFRERIQVNGEMIPKEALTELVERIQPMVEQVGELTEFELITALGFCWFAQQNCDIVVLEVGLGGRFDATNVIDAPLVAVITPIGLDHTQVLGDTIQQIAREKCGILKPGSRVVTSGNQDVDALAVILETACANQIVVVQPTLKAAEQVHMTLEGTDLIYNGYQLHIPLAGKHQIDNALTAFEAVSELELHYGFQVSAEAIKKGIAGVRFPGRMEVVCQDPLTILDGAHNPHGAKALKEALSLLEGRPITAVMGVLEDKDSEGVLELLAPCFKRLICVTLYGNPRALDGHALAAQADALGLQASAAHSLGEGLELAQMVAQAEKGVVVVCGSLYLVSGLRKILKER